MNRWIYLVLLQHNYGIVDMNSRTAIANIRVLHTISVIPVMYIIDQIHYVAKEISIRTIAAAMTLPVTSV